MNDSNQRIAPLLFLVIFFTTTCFKSIYCAGKATILCHEIEKQALLILKRSIEKDPTNLLSSWDAAVHFDCCMWEGVVCHNLTGHVHELHLRGRLGHSIIDSGKELNPSLLNLQRLRFLDLSQNHFGATIPAFIGSFANLEHLNLTDAGFHGTVPCHIGNLSNLHTLSLQESRRSLEVGGLEWLSGLSRLENLDMSYVDLNKATNWVHVINTLPSLIELHFKSCVLDSISPLDRVNLSSLVLLDLSYNRFQNAIIPSWIFQQNELIFLDLSMNSFGGSIPSTSNITKLQYIDISSNYINSTIPDWLYVCNHLEFAVMSYNILHGTISNSIANLSSLKTLDLFRNKLSGQVPATFSTLMCHIQTLDLSDNNLQGDISNILGSVSEYCSVAALKVLYLAKNELCGNLPDQFENFKNLQILDLGYNSLSGPIPMTLGQLSSLTRLDLGFNKMSGDLPESFGQLSNLEFVSLTDNMLEGVVSESHFANLMNLIAFHASRNHLTLNVSPFWIPPFKLDVLKLGSWNIGTQIPPWLETQKNNISQLDLSSTGLISDSIPDWFWNIYSLNLSHNQLHGNIPDLKDRFPKLIFLSSNKFSGPLPRVANSVLVLDLSNNSFSGGLSHFLCDTTDEIDRALAMLDLGGNQLSGEIPDCFMKWTSLTFLNLSNNRISGGIPDSIAFLGNLVSLNLYNNMLSGYIPSSVSNCTKLAKIDLGENEFFGTIPTWLGISLTKLRFLILRSNKLSGKLPPEICHLNFLQILDISDNNFSGTIPRCINNLTGMTNKGWLVKHGIRDLQFHFYSMTFFESAYVSTKGSQFHYDTILPLVTNMDLSKNNFSGEIPVELTSLVELRSLNLSENGLIGLIPDGIGNMKQLESLDLSMNSLSGEIPGSFSLLCSLNYMNLSYNKLTGRIPESTQLQSFPKSSFIGNDLCGPPLTSTCNNDHYVDASLHNHTPYFEVDWFYMFLTLGYATGFSVVCTTLILKKKWRDAYFGFLSGMWNNIYVWYKTC